MKKIKSAALIIADEFLAVFTVLAAMISERKYAEEEAGLIG